MLVWRGVIYSGGHPKETRGLLLELFAVLVTGEPQPQHAWQVKMRLLIPRCIWCKAKPDYMPKKCGRWGEHVCHSMSRCSFPGVNFSFLKFSFCFYPDSRFASGHLLAFWWRDIKKPWNLLRFLLVLQMCLLRRPFLCTDTALLSFWASLLFVSKTSFPCQRLA